MPGFIFYLIAWSGWIYTTFIMGKNIKGRFLISFSLLMTIILSVHYMNLFDMEISLSAIFLILIGYAYFGKRTILNLIKITLRVMIVSLAGATFLLMALYDPFWIIIDLYWIQGALFMVIAKILFSDYKVRVVATVIGLVQADIIYGIFLTKLNMNYSILSLDYLDQLAVTCLFITVWFAIERIQYFFQKNNQLEKEKQF